MIRDYGKAEIVWVAVASTQSMNQRGLWARSRRGMRYNRGARARSLARTARNRLSPGTLGATRRLKLMGVSYGRHPGAAIHHVCQRSHP